MIATIVISAAIVIVLATWEKSPFRIYCKSEAGMAFVRTGLGGAKPVIGRAALVVPLLHKIQWVDLAETKLVIVRKGRESILTKDHLRADLQAEFYVRVSANRESVYQASIALGRRAQQAEGLRDFLEPNLLDALQAVASEMTLQDLHDNRIQFNTMVQDRVLEDLNRKGLELTNVSLTSLDQTPLEFYDADNVFDAAGLLAIREITEQRKKERNEIEKDQALLIDMKNLEVRKQLLELERERSFAEQDARKAIEVQKEERDRELTQLRLQQRSKSEEARIVYDKELKEKELAKERYLDEQRIAHERAVELAKIDKIRELDESRIGLEKEVQQAAIQREIELAAEKQKKEETLIAVERTIEALKIEKDRLLEQQRISKLLDTEAAKIDTEKKLEEERINKDKWTRLVEIARELELVEEQKKRDLAELARNKAVELAKRARELALAGEEKAIALARTELAETQSRLEEAEQETLKVRITSQAERQRLAALVRAEEAAAVSRIERTTAIDLSAREMTQLAEARLDAAYNEAKARITVSEAKRTESLVAAEGERVMVEARNLTSEHVFKNARQTQLIGELAKIAAELMKPAEKIESIKVVHVEGFGSVPLVRGTDGDTNESLLSQRGAQSAIATIISGILQVGAFKPVFKQLLGEDGLAELDNDRLVQALKDLAPGLIEAAGKEVVRTSIRNELQTERETAAQRDRLETEREDNEKE